MDLKTGQTFASSQSAAVDKHTRCCVTFLSVQLQFIQSHCACRDRFQSITLLGIVDVDVVSSRSRLQAKREFETIAHDVCHARKS